MGSRVAFKRQRSCCAAFAISIFAALFHCAPAQAELIPGIDVSRWQGTIDWIAVKNSGVKFAFAKATEGVDFVDIRYHANMQGARAAGVYIGPYHFCRLDSFATNPLDPINEANDFIEAILPYYQTGQHLPPVADVEAFPPFGSNAEAKAFTSNWVQKFSDTVYNALGVRPIVYQSLSKANTYYTPEVASSHELWLAWWKHSTASPPQPSDTPLWGDWQFWQWTDSWSVPGVAGPVDGDVYDGTMSQLKSLLLGNKGTPGDYDGDGVVGVGDYVMWRKTMGMTVPLYTGADGNGNARVDEGDFSVWQKNFNRTYGAGAGGVSVPEPTSVCTVVLGLCVAAMSIRSRRGSSRFATVVAAVALIVSFANSASAQLSSKSAWEAAEFRSWSFVPYWTSVSQVQSFATDRVYDHLSDVVYHSGVQPRADGSLFTGTTATNHLATLKNHQAQFGFRYHLDMYDAVRNSGESAADAVERVWNAITSNPSTREIFIDNVQNVLAANNMTGFNLDWERPNTVTEWGNYTQLAREMQAAFPEHWEVSVDDYGFADSRWDDSPLFDARVYDQIGIMGYHYPADNGTSLDQQSFAKGKRDLLGQGEDKAFKDSQIILGMGTWGAGVDPDGNNGPMTAPPTVRLKNIVAVDPDLPPDASSFTGTVPGLDGTPQTGTWDIVSRYEVRDIVQLALDRGMAGVMWWALSYDATNEMSLARVAQHYAMFQRGVPDLTLDGKVNAADANALANNMGTAPGWTGTNSPAQFEDFYMNGNWEQGDRDGNGFVNQQDADWLAGRFTALEVNLPDRLAYSGTFENLQNSRGLTGRWEAKRESGGNLRETGNFTQHGAAGISWTGTGVGAVKRSNNSITIRNQNAEEVAAGINNLPRQLNVDLSTPIDLSKNTETYFTFLVRGNTASLLPAQVPSANRILALEFLDGAGVNQFDFALRGMHQQFAIQSQADAAGQDVQAGGFLPNTTYLVVGKIAGNGVGANTLKASIFANGATVGNFASDSFPWTLTAQSSAGFNPTITQLQFSSLAEGNYSVSNVWIGSAADFFATPAAAAGDFNADGMVDVADYIVWVKTRNMTGSLLPADGNGNGVVDDDDYVVWQQNAGRVLAGAGGQSHGDSTDGVVPEPTGFLLLALAGIMGFIAKRR
jgi:GH25 family lysozyme M1 (1,4-beta-N-acetylmuramidase)